MHVHAPVQPRGRSAPQHVARAHRRGAAAQILALQRTAGNRATAALLQRACACAGSHSPCEDCAEDHGADVHQRRLMPVALLQRTPARKVSCAPGPL